MPLAEEVVRRAARFVVPLAVRRADAGALLRAALVLVAVVLEVDASLRRVRAEQIGVAILVAGGDQLLQFQLLEIVREVVKEIADRRIVAVAQNRLALKMRDVMPQLLFDV